jgi:hypothetical protein
MQQNKTTHCQLLIELTKPKHQNKTATPLRLTKAPVCLIRSPETDKPAKQQTRNNNNTKKTKHVKQNSICHYKD